MLRVTLSMRDWLSPNSFQVSIDSYMHVGYTLTTVSASQVTQLAFRVGKPSGIIEFTNATSCRHR